MDKKDLIKRYIEVVDICDKVSHDFNYIFNVLCEDNKVQSVVPRELLEFTEYLVNEQLSKNEILWLHDWTYKYKYYDEPQRRVFVSDVTGAGTIHTFEEFYDFVFEQKPLNEIFSKRSGKFV